LELLGPAPGDVARATPKPQPRTPRHEATPATDGNVFAQELQHRVRNNLQAIHGMLAEQIQITADDSARHGLSTIAHRVTALAEIYNHLLGAGLSQTIDLGSYLASLCASFESLEQERHPLVKLTCRWDVVSVDLDNATVLGLVVAELISNSYDHAFGSGAGTITVSLLCSQPGDQACIVFADDGSGFDETGKAGRHGLGLVRRLMQQVNGLAAVRRHNGTEWLLKFPTSLPAERSVGITATLQTV
jgi:two-component sensor histidine kinase